MEILSYHPTLTIPTVMVKVVKKREILSAPMPSSPSPLSPMAMDSMVPPSSSSRKNKTPSSRSPSPSNNRLLSSPSTGHPSSAKLMKLKTTLDSNQPEGEPLFINLAKPLQQQRQKQKHQLTNSLVTSEEIEFDREKRQQIYRFLPNPTFNPDYYYQFYDLNNISRPVMRHRITRMKIHQKPRKDSTTIRGSVMNGKKVSVQTIKLINSNAKRKEGKNQISKKNEGEQQQEKQTNEKKLTKNLQIQSIYDGKRAVLPFTIQSIGSRGATRFSSQKKLIKKVPETSTEVNHKSVILPNIVFEREESTGRQVKFENSAVTSSSHLAKVSTATPGLSSPQQPRSPTSLSVTGGRNELYSSEEKEDQQFNDSFDDYDKPPQKEAVPFVGFTAATRPTSSSKPPIASGERSIFIGSESMQSSQITNLTNESTFMDGSIRLDNRNPMYEYYRKNYYLTNSDNRKGAQQLLQQEIDQGYPFSFSIKAQKSFSITRDSVEGEKQSKLQQEANYRKKYDVTVPQPSASITPVGSAKTPRRPIQRKSSSRSSYRKSPSATISQQGLNFSSYVKNPTISLYDQSGNTFGLPTTDVTSEFVVGKDTAEEEIDSRDISAIIRDPNPIKPSIKLTDFEIPLDPMTERKIIARANMMGMDELKDDRSMDVNYNLSETSVMSNIPVPQLPALLSRSRSSFVAPVVPTATTDKIAVVSNPISIDDNRPKSANKARADQFSAQLQAGMKLQRDLFSPEPAKNQTDLAGFVQDVSIMPSIITVDNENTELIAYCDTISDVGDKSPNNPLRSEFFGEEGMIPEDNTDEIEKELPPIIYDESSLFIKTLEENNPTFFYPKNYLNKLTPQYEIVELLGRGRFSTVWKSKNHLSTRASFLEAERNMVSSPSSSGARRKKSMDESNGSNEYIAIKVYHSSIESIVKGKNELQFYTQLSEYLSKLSKEFESTSSRPLTTGAPSLSSSPTAIATAADPAAISFPSPAPLPSNINRQDLNLCLLTDFLMFQRFYCFAFPIYSQYNLYEINQLLAYQQSYIYQSINRHFSTLHHPYRQQIEQLLHRQLYSSSSSQPVITSSFSTPGTTSSTPSRRNYLYHIEELKQINVQLLNGLYHLHRELQMIHGDLKPENILVSMTSASIYHLNDEIQDLIQYFQQYSSRIFPQTDAQLKKGFTAGSSGSEGGVGGRPIQNEGEIWCKMPFWRKVRDFHVVIIDFSHAMKVAEAGNKYYEAQDAKRVQMIQIPGTFAGNTRSSNIFINSKSFDDESIGIENEKKEQSNRRENNNNNPEDEDLLQSQFYRSPEIMLQKEFDTKIDIWSLGCIMMELILQEPLFQGESNEDQLACVCELLGPIPKDWIVTDSAKKATNSDLKPSPPSGSPPSSTRRTMMKARSPSSAKEVSKPLKRPSGGTSYNPAIPAGDKQISLYRQKFLLLSQLVLPYRSPSGKWRKYSVLSLESMIKDYYITCYSQSKLSQAVQQLAEAKNSDEEREGKRRKGRRGREEEEAEEESMQKMDFEMNMMFDFYKKYFQFFPTDRSSTEELLCHLWLNPSTKE